MTSFTVDPAALCAYARLLERAGDDDATMKEYVGQYAQGSTGGELISIAREGHQHATAQIDAVLSDLAAILAASGPELTGAAGHYRSTDLTAARLVDATLPPAPGRCLTPLEYELTAMVCPPAPFADPRPVTDRLTAAEPPAPRNALGWMDYLSPSSWAMKGFDAVLGFDPIGWLQERFAGDWEALASMEPVLNNTAAAVHDLALNVQSGASTMRPAWQGNAGDAAYRYFTDLATAITALQEPLRRMGQEYRAVADAVWSAGEALGGIIKALVDAAIIAGIAAAAGTATAASGVGAVVGYGVAAVEVATILRLWSEATKLYQSASAAVFTFRAALGHRLNDLTTITLPALPDIGYDHPIAEPAGRSS